jgi:hypothetical protein
MPRAPVHHRRRGGGGKGKGLTQSSMFASVVGGFALGVVDKALGGAIPTIPMLGRAGTIAVGAYLFRGKGGGIMRDIAIAGAAIAGYQLGSKGSVSGDIADQVHGVAAQV